MKIAILSRSPKCYSTRRLKEAAIKRGHNALVLNTLQFSISVEPGNPSLHYRGKLLSTYDAVIPRIGASITFFGLAVVRQFEQMGVYALNESIAISRSRDKLRSAQILSRHNIGLPRTAFIRSKKDIIPAIERVGGVPVIIKVLEGTQGVGVILADSIKVAEAIVETLQTAKQNVLIQHFVKESRGKDIRAFVVGNRVVAAMRRSAVGDEYRSNVHRGGTTESVTLSPEYEKTAVTAAHVMGLTVAGVDMLEGVDGPNVMEVNSSPGLEGIEGATKVDVAGAIIEEVEQRVSVPDFDLRKRLRLGGSQAVVEIVLRDMPAFEGKKLKDSPFAGSKSRVLAIDRAHTFIPNPGAEDVLLAGDKLVCFGNMEELRTMLPQPTAQKNTGRRTVREGVQS